MTEYLDKYQTDNFYLKTGESETTEGQRVYQLVNKNTDLIEYEDHILARAVSTLMKIEEHLKEADLEFTTGLVSPSYGEERPEGVH